MPVRGLKAKRGKAGPNIQEGLLDTRDRMTGLAVSNPADAVLHAAPCPAPAGAGVTGGEVRGVGAVGNLIQVTLSQPAGANAPSGVTLTFGVAGAPTIAAFAGSQPTIDKLVADLKLDVKGTGQASAKSTEGILTRIFNFLF